MTNTPRSRSRTRPETTERSEEVKEGGRPVSTSEVTEHTPVREHSLHAGPSGYVARIRVEDGVTINMGNYNSFRRTVALELEVPLGDRPYAESGALTKNTVAALNTASDNAAEWLAGEMAGAIEDARDYFEDK